MALSSDKAETEAVVMRLLDNLGVTITSKSAREGSEVRKQIGEVRAHYSEQLKNGTFPQELNDIFIAIRAANVTLASLAFVRTQLFAEAPTYDIPIAIVQMAVGFCLSAESQLIAAIEFKSRADVENVMVRMSAAFATAREMAADNDNSAYYQQLTFLAGAVVSHLATVARPLPRMITFKLPVTMPALTLSNRIYYTAERWEEIVNENKTIHPAFCQREIIGMSS